MRGDVYVSGGGKVRQLSFGQGNRIREALIDDCGAICVQNGTVFAASGHDGVIYRLDERLLPCGVFAGGPGVREMCVSQDGERLYALVSDADSLLMMNAGDGEPIFLARAGVTPCRMRFDDEEKTLTVAGGRDGSASLLCALTLERLCTYHEDGFCCDAMTVGDMTYMLMMTSSMNSRLVFRGKQTRWQMDFPGWAGTIGRLGRMILISAGEWMYYIDPVRKKTCRKEHLSCTAGKLISVEAGWLMLSYLDESLHLFDGRKKRLLCMDARDVAVE